MDIVSVALKRYSTKAFDPSKKLTAEEADKIKTTTTVQPLQHQFPAVALYCRQYGRRQSARSKIRCRKLHVQRTQNAGRLPCGGLLRQNRNG